jgi:uncharacterized protein (DUF2062 family)
MTPTANPPAQPSRLRKFWRERVVALVVAQFTQGVTPQKIALTIALGLNLAVFPILGSTTLLCALVALWLRLNQPVIQLANWLAYPLQFLLLPVFIRIGEWIMRAPPVTFSIPELLRKFRESPVKFFHEFGLTAVHGIVAWLVIAPFSIALIYFVLLVPLKKLAGSLNRITND